MNKVLKVNPLFGIMEIDSFLYTLQKILLKDKGINLFIIYFDEYKVHRKESLFFAKMQKLEIIEKLYSIDNNAIIGAYENDKILVISTINLAEKALNMGLKLHIGATKSLKNDDMSSIMIRTEKALNNARKNNLKFTIL